MTRTYIVEDCNQNIIEYCEKLRAAKKVVEVYCDEQARIIMMKGPYFGEGYHQYALRFIEGKFRKELV